MFDGGQFSGIGKTIIKVAIVIIVVLAIVVWLGIKFLT